VTTRAGVGDGTPSDLGFDAMADVDRIFRGRLIAEMDCERGGGALELVVGGDRGFSGLGVLLPPLCTVGDLEDLGDSGCDWDSD
jgi:hypothetical protein